MLMRRIHELSLAGAALLLMACGGGGGGGGATNGGTPGLQISGTAATGAAIVSGTVEAKCKVGTGTATTNAAGNYTLEVASGEQPCILRVTDPISRMKLHSMAEAGASKANISPATDLVVANTLAENPSTAYANYSVLHHQKITAGNISTAVSRVQTATAALGADADMKGIDIMKGMLQAATSDAPGNAADAKIDALMAALAAADKKISELSALLATTSSGTSAASELKTFVGNAQYALASCPAARSGDIWVLDLHGSQPLGFNANFNTMVLKNLADNSTSAIYFKRDAQNNAIPCAFTANVNATNVEVRVSAGGIGVWKSANDFGITVPAQRSQSLTDIAYAGAYPTAGFLRERTYGVRAAVPFKFQIKTDGSLQGYSCDLTKAIPDCNTAIENNNSGDTTCTPLSNGTLSCSAANGLRATAVLYVAGGQASMFMAVTQMPFNGYSFGGLIVMTKAAPMQLPTAGQTIAAGSAWYAGVDPGSNTVVSGDSSAGRVESISTSSNAFVTSSVGSSTRFTSYLNTPTDGFQLSNASNGDTAITVGSSMGWSMSMAKKSGSTAYDGWAVYARAKR